MSEDFWRTPQGLVTLQDCMDCKQPYPQWSVLSNMTCPSCRVARERERCAKMVEGFEDWIWPDKKSEAVREAGDWAGPLTDESLKKLANDIREHVYRPDRTENSYAEVDHASLRKGDKFEFGWCGVCVVTEAASPANGWTTYFKTPDGTVMYSRRVKA